MMLPAGLYSVEDAPLTVAGHKQFLIPNEI